MKFEDIKYSDYRRIKDRIDLFLAVLIYPVLISQVLYFVPLLAYFDPWTGFMIPRYQLISCVIVTILSFFSFARISATHNKELRKDFFESEMPKAKSFDKIKFFFSVKRFKIFTLIFALVYIIIPTKFLYTSFWDLFLNKNEGFLANLIFKIVSLAVFAILLIWAHVTAAKDWEIDKVKENNHQKVEVKKHAFMREVLSTLLVYCVGGIGIWYIWPMILGWLNFFVLLYKEAKAPSLIILAILIITPFAYRAIRAISIRRKFLKGLKKLAKDKKCRISEIKYPYKSIFSVYKGESFTLNVNGTTYSCKLFGAPKKYTPFVLFPNGHGVWHIVFKVLRFEIYSYDKGFNFGYESKHQKILIVNPIPKFYYTSFGGKTIALDNGDTVGGYKIYSATAFINAIDRNCLDR